jgi:hypothetical protein
LSNWPLPYPSDLGNCTEIRFAKNCSISITYEFHTKSAQSAGLENNGQREGISRLSSSIAVQGLSAKCSVYWGFLRSRKPKENVRRGPSGGRDRFELPVRNRVSTLVISVTYARPIWAGKRMLASFDRSIDHHATSAHIKCGGFWGTSAPRVSQHGPYSGISVSDPDPDIAGYAGESRRLFSFEVRGPDDRRPPLDLDLRDTPQARSGPRLSGRWQPSAQQRNRSADMFDKQFHCGT